MPTMLVVIIALIAVIILLLAWLASGWMLKRRAPDPPCAPDSLGLSYEQVAFPSRDGLQLAGRLIPAGGEGRPTIVFCAGMFGSMDGDTGLLPMLVEAGFGVLQFDWRAHGASGGDRETLGLREVQDVLGALDFLAGRGVGRIGLMGFSFGGAVALRAAAQDTRALCVVCDGGFVKLAHALEGLLAERIGAAPALACLPLIHAVLWLAGLRLGKSLGRAEPLDSVGQISPRPVLFIHGDADPFVPRADQDAIFAACHEPKTLWRVEGAAHREIHKQHPDAYRDHVVTFFSRALLGVEPERAHRTDDPFTDR